jgi:hypothetical protein
METDSKPLSTFWKVTCVLLFVAGLSTCLFRPHESTNNAQTAAVVAPPPPSKSDRARAIFSHGTNTSAVDNHQAALREFQGPRPDGGQYVAFERLKSERLPQPVTVFLFEPPLAHDAQEKMVGTALRDTYGLSEVAIAGLANLRFEDSAVGRALVVDDERYTYTLFSARVSDEDRRWGALIASRTPR